jgi:hypothetical protein
MRSKAQARVWQPATATAHAAAKHMLLHTGSGSWKTRNEYELGSFYTNN